MTNAQILETSVVVSNTKSSPAQYEILLSGQSRKIQQKLWMKSNFQLTTNSISFSQAQQFQERYKAHLLAKRNYGLCRAQQTMNQIKSSENFLFKNFLNTILMKHLLSLSMKQILIFLFPERSDARLSDPVPTKSTQTQRAKIFTWSVRSGPMGSTTLKHDAVHSQVSLPMTICAES